MYNNCKVYGPYLNKKDNREKVILIFDSGKRKTVYYPKYLMELHLGLYLDKDETVDHLDKNPLNNNLENLRVLSRKEHCTLDAIRLKEKSFNCPLCNVMFKLSGRKLHDAILNRKQNKAGPFCSRNCAGKYGKNIQLKIDEKLDIIEIQPEYITLKDI